MLRMRLREEPDASSGIGAHAQAIFDRLIEELLDIVPEWPGLEFVLCQIGSLRKVSLQH